MSSLQQLNRRNTGRRNLWFERVMALAATVNLGLVLFDLSYVPWRDFYLRQFPAFTLRLPTLTLRCPALTQLYDQIKAIEPNRDTQEYLDTVQALKEQVAQTGVQSPQVEPLLESLRRQSSEMIDNNPFELANKSGTLEKIKNQMRKRIYNTSSREQSARQAFNIFWSQEYISANAWQQEIKFFDENIQPLLQTNYYRPIGENGEFIDYFWLYIDLPFFILFSLDFLARTFYISRQHTGISWPDAMLWRWYDIFLLLPFWRWLRVIPVIIRLNQAELLDLERVQEQVAQGFVASFAEELTEVVVIRVINQIQGAIERGEITSSLFQNANRRSYIDINNVNEVEAISNLLVQTTVYQVLPKIQPDIEAILRHNIESVLNQSPIYRGWQNLPGVGSWPTQLTQQLAAQVTQGVYSALVAAVEDPVGAKLSSQLMQHFSEALGTEVQKKHTLLQIQALLKDMLEEVKLNYIKRLTEEDVEQILEETRQLHFQAAKHAEGKNPVLPKPKS